MNKSLKKSISTNKKESFGSDLFINIISLVVVSFCAGYYFRQNYYMFVYVVVILLTYTLYILYPRKYVIPQKTKTMFAIGLMFVAFSIYPFIVTLLSIQHINDTNNLIGPLILTFPLLVGIGWLTPGIILVMLSRIKLKQIF